MLPPNITTRSSNLSTISYFFISLVALPAANEIKP